MSDFFYLELHGCSVVYITYGTFYFFFAEGHNVAAADRQPSSDLNVLSTQCHVTVTRLVDNILNAMQLAID